MAPHCTGSRKSRSEECGHNKPKPDSALSTRSSERSSAFPKSHSSSRQHQTTQATRGGGREAGHQARWGPSWGSPGSHVCFLVYERPGVNPINILLTLSSCCPWDRSIPEKKVCEALTRDIIRATGDKRSATRFTPTPKQLGSDAPATSQSRVLCLQPNIQHLYSELGSGWGLPREKQTQC